MAWGGGTFEFHNKTLPGAYINFVSAAKANLTLSERGIAAMPLVLDWCPDDQVMTVTNEDFISYAQTLFGYDYSHEKLKGLRDYFKNGKTLHIYKLNSDGVKATNTFATAKYSGVRGNDIKIVVNVNVDDETKFDVKTYLDTVLFDTQTVSAASELVDNDFVTFKTDAELVETASTPLSGGTNGTDVTSSGGQWEKALTALETVSFNTLGVVCTTNDIIAYVIAWTKRMRDEVGVKFQTVVYRTAADDKAIISVENTIVGEESANLIYWVTGAQAGCKVNASLTNTVYDGEFDVNVNYSQDELKEAIKAGKFMLHKVNDTVKVLTDINTKVTVTEIEGEDFKHNQTIRVIDQIGNDIAALWTSRYLGKIPNDNAGRISFWNDVVTICKELLNIRAIENFESEDITIAQGSSKRDVVVNSQIEVVNCMEKLYMTCVIA